MGRDVLYPDARTNAFQIPEDQQGKQDRIHDYISRTWMDRGSNVFGWEGVRD